MAMPQLRFRSLADNSNQASGLQVGDIFLKDEQGQFPAGSMGPKIESAIEFLDSGGDRMVITSLAKAEEGLRGKAGTTIMASR